MNMDLKRIGFLFSYIVLTSSQAGADALTFDQLATAIQSHDIRSVEALFQQTGSAPFDLMAIVQDSGSLQATVAPTATNPLVPRIILSDKEAKFIVAFNGAGSIKGSGSLDIFELDPVTRTYTPSVVEFDPNGVQPPSRVANNIPNDCKTCHFPLIGSHPHPDFLNLQLTPTILGSLNGKLSIDDKKTLRAFVESPDYKTQYAIVGNVSKKTGLALGTVGVQAKEMGRQITENIYDGYAKTLAAVPAFLPYRYAFLGALSCSNFTPAAFLPAATISAFPSAVLATTQSVVTNRQSAFTDAITTWKQLNPSNDPLISKIPEDVGGSVEDNFTYLSQNILTVANGYPLNYDWFSLTLALQSETGRLSNLSVYFSQYMLVGSEDASLSAIYKTQSGSRPSRTTIFRLGGLKKSVCGELAQRSLVSLSASK
jgi:hypothetical protein